MERDGHVREASSIKFDGINRSRSGERSIARLRFSLGMRFIDRDKESSSSDNATVRHGVIEYVYTIFICAI